MSPGPEGVGSATTQRPVAVTLAALAVSVGAALPMLLLGALAVRVSAELGFGPAGLGAATAAYFLAATVASAPLGRLADRIGAERALRVAAIVGGSSALGIGLMAASLSHLAALLVVAGVGNALAHPAANLALVRGVRVGRQGLVFGVKQSSIPVAALLAGTSVLTVGQVLGWRGTYVVAGLGAMAVALVVPRSGGVRRARRIPRRGGRQAVRAVGPLVLMSAGAGIAAMPANALGSFLVLTHVEAGASEFAAGTVLAVSSALGALTRIVVGWGSDRRPQARFAVVTVMILSGAVAFTMLGATDHPAVLVTASILAFTAGWGWSGLLNVAVAASQPAVAASATGVVQAGIYLGAALGPVGFGLVAEQASLALAWTWSTLLAILGGLLLSAASRWMRRRLAVDDRTEVADGR